MSALVSRLRARAHAIETGARLPDMDAFKADLIEAAGKIEAIAAALEPIMHWYDGEPADGDEHEPRELVDILTDVVADLQSDRDSVIALTGILNADKRQLEEIYEGDVGPEIARGSGNEPARCHRRLQAGEALRSHIRARAAIHGRPITGSGKP